MEREQQLRQIDRAVEGINLLVDAAGELGFYNPHRKAAQATPEQQDAAYQRLLERKRAGLAPLKYTSL